VPRKTCAARRAARPSVGKHAGCSQKGDAQKGAQHTARARGLRAPLPIAAADSRGAAELRASPSIKHAQNTLKINTPPPTRMLNARALRAP